MSHLHDLDEHAEPDARLYREGAGTPGVDAGDSSFSDHIAKLCHNFGDALKNPAHAAPYFEELVDFQTDEGVLSLRKRDTTAGFTDAHKMTMFVAILEYTYLHPSLPDQFAARYVFDKPWLDDMINHLTQTEFAEAVGVEKQRVNQAVDQAFEHFKRKGFTMPRRPEMRKAPARDTMSTAYLKSVGERTNHKTKTAK